MPTTTEVSHSACPKRCRYADFLPILALDFVLLHEFGHLLHGHLDFLQAGNLRSCISEMAEALLGRNHQEAIDSQTLEYDADMFAVGKMYRKIISDDFRVISTFVAQPADFQDRAYLFHSALQILFNVLDDLSKGLTGPAELRLHPPAIYRGNYAHAAAVEFVTNTFGAQTGEIYAHAAMYGSIETTIAFKKAAQVQSGTAEEANESWRKGGVYLDNLHANWRSVRPRLAGFQLGGSLAPG